MTYTYGVKGVPAVGSGLGGLPRRRDIKKDRPPKPRVFSDFKVFEAYAPDPTQINVRMRNLFTGDVENEVSLSSKNKTYAEDIYRLTVSSKKRYLIVASRSRRSSGTTHDMTLRVLSLPTLQMVSTIYSTERELRLSINDSTNEAVITFYTNSSYSTANTYELDEILLKDGATSLSQLNLKRTREFKRRSTSNSELFLMWYRDGKVMTSNNLNYIYLWDPNGDPLFKVLATNTEPKLDENANFYGLSYRSTTFFYERAYRLNYDENGNLLADTEEVFNSSALYDSVDEIGLSSFVFHDGEVYVYGRASKSNTDVRLKTANPDGSIKLLPPELLYNRPGENDRFSVGDGLVRGVFDPDSKSYAFTAPIDGSENPLEGERAIFHFKVEHNAYLIERI